MNAQRTPNGRKCGCADNGLPATALHYARGHRRSSELRKRVSVRRISNTTSDPRGFAARRVHYGCMRAHSSRSKGRNTETRLGGANALRRAKTGRRKEIMQTRERRAVVSAKPWKLSFHGRVENFPASTRPIPANAA